MIRREVRFDSDPDYLVLLYDRGQFFVRLVQHVNGKPTFVTPKLEITAKELVRLGSTTLDEKSFRAGELTLMGQGSSFFVSRPQTPSLRAPRARYRTAAWTLMDEAGRAAAARGASDAT